MGGKAAPVCNLIYDDYVEGDILVQDVLVPSNGIADYTYYCCMQWNTGQDGGGYCGIQKRPSGTNFIFSLNNPKSKKDHIQIPRKHPDTEMDKEGTILKTLNSGVEWKADQWYTLVLRRWDQNGHTFFGFWVRLHDEDKWEHIITMDFPMKNVSFKTYTKSFIEDWFGTGEMSRRVHLKNGYKRKMDHSWVHFSKGRFSVNQSGRTKLYNDNWDGGCQDDYFYLQTGLGTTSCPEILADKNIILPETETTQPPCLAISFTFEEVTKDGIVWTVPDSSTPQFAFQIFLNEKEVASGLDHDKRSHPMELEEGAEVKVILEDVLGRKAEIQIVYQEPEIVAGCCLCFM